MKELLFEKEYDRYNVLLKHFDELNIHIQAQVLHIITLALHIHFNQLLYQSL